MSRTVLRVLAAAIITLVPAWAYPAPPEPGASVGIEGRYLTADQIADLFNIEVAGGGVLIEHVLEGTPAARAGLRGGDLPATIHGEPLILGGDILLQLEIHKVCSGTCLQTAAVDLTTVGWIGATYLRHGRVLRAVIDLNEIPIEPVNPDLIIP